MVQEGNRAIQNMVRQWAPSPILYDFLPTHRIMLEHTLKTIQPHKLGLDGKSNKSSAFSGSWTEAAPEVGLKQLRGNTVKSG